MTFAYKMGDSPLHAEWHENDLLKLNQKREMSYE